MGKFPELMKLKEEFKNKTLLEYVHEHLLRKRELLPLDVEAYKVFCKNFKQDNIRRISTGSHMAFLQWEESFGLGENILVNLPHLLNENENIISSPCSRITFKSQTRPGSVDLSHMGEKSMKLSRYTLRGRSKITLNKAEKITEQEMENFLQSFYKFQKSPSMFKFINQEKLSAFIKYAKQMVKKGETFNEQSSWFSSQLWPHLFNDFESFPLIIKPLEDLQVKRENLLVNKKLRTLLEKHFKDHYGVLSSTYFYYGSCKCGIEFPLEKREDAELVYLEGNCLDKDCLYFGTKKYSVEGNNIIKEVEKKNLNETLFITFYNIWALAGIDVLGGFNQAEYLKEFRDKLCLIFQEIGENKKSEILKKRATNLLDLGVFAAFNADGIPKSGSQVFLEGGLDKQYVEQFSKLNFSKTIDVSLQTINSLFGEKPNHSLTVKMLKDNKMEFMIK
ncbi:hypothetical protein HZC31_04370 [Candidatus Woesearchaeota archaeon]|nr:hypothetical protein [Candidatus Woesearchaeota archaeon]